MLEEILREYFGCQEPFSDRSKYRPFTKKGVQAYNRLVELIVDLENMGLSVNADRVITELDEISNL